MIILGIDPGSSLIGYGVVKTENRRIVCLDYGVLKIKAKETELRLIETRKLVKKLLAEFKPDKAVLERLFFFKNRKTVIEVAQARGVILMTIAENKIPVTEVAPLELKNALTGFGRASKGSVQKMVKLILNLKEEPKPDDAADALALAILGSNSNYSQGG